MDGGGDKGVVEGPAKVATLGPKGPFRLKGVCEAGGCWGSDLSPIISHLDPGHSMCED